MSREYHYVGPDEIRQQALKMLPGVRILTLKDLVNWIDRTDTDRLLDGTVVATYAISIHRALLLAARRSEHVACASGGPVLSAGEISINTNLVVTEISNQSTGFCPEPESWDSVASVLDQIPLVHPRRFTTEIVYRRCPRCHERNSVKDSWYYCAVCDCELPEFWNFS